MTDVLSNFLRCHSFARVALTEENWPRCGVRRERTKLPSLPKGMQSHVQRAHERHTCQGSSGNVCPSQQPRGTVPAGIARDAGHARPSPFQGRASPPRAAPCRTADASALEVDAEGYIN